MKKSARKIITGIGIFLIVAAAFPAAYMYIFRSETKKMSPQDTGEIISGIYAVKTQFVDLYLVKGAGGYIAIDAGNDAKETALAMKSLGIDPLTVSAVFLTHTDADHTAAVPLFTKAKVYISKAEAAMVNGATHRFFIFNNSLPRPYETLDDARTVTVDGISVKGISTPGHTPGSMCYLVNGSYLFTGDTLSLHEGRAELFNEAFNMDSKREKSSIGKLAALRGVKLVLTAHYGYTDNFAGAFRDRTGK